jgi:Arc/MetJ-type ribon-helix-helix transcriptional regulator
MKDGLQTLKAQRQDKEKTLLKDGKDTPYPSWDALRAEDNEEAPSVFVEVRDANGNLVQRINGASGKGFHRIAWDMRYPALAPVNLKKPSGYVPPWGKPPKGPLALPGEYTATLVKRQKGELSALSEPMSFTLKLLNNSPEITQDRAALLAVQQRTNELYRRVQGAVKMQGEFTSRINHVKEAIRILPASTEEHAQAIRNIEQTLRQADLLLSGDKTVSSRQEPVPWSVRGRTSFLYSNVVSSQNPVSGNHLASLEIAEAEYQSMAAQLVEIDSRLSKLEADLETLGAPWTPGRIAIVQN